MKNNNTKKLLSSLLPYLKRHSIFLIFSFVLSFISVILSLYVPILFGNAIDTIVGVGNVDFASLSSFLIKSAICIILHALTVWLMNSINTSISYSVVKDIRNEAIEHINKLPLSYLDAHPAGDIITTIINDTDILSSGLLLGFSQFFTSIITIVATIYFMFTKNIIISLIVIILTPLTFIVSSFISRKSFNLFKKQSNMRGEENSFINEMISSIRTVKAYGYEKKSISRFTEINNEYSSSSESAVFYSSLTNPCTRFVTNIIYALVALFGVIVISKNLLSVGGLVVMLSYAKEYMKPFNDLSAVRSELQNSFSSFSRILSLLSAKVEEKESSKKLEKAEGNISIENVSFSYSSEKKLIEDLSLDVKKGTRVAIVGPTGCGKTTFINLLMRFYDPNLGSIKIDGIDIRDITRHSLRSSYGMVLQDTWIKEGSVRENIAFCKRDAKDEEIIMAAKASHSWDFIEHLENGLDTIINENSLSSGQKQLICISRVMLLQPPILILDEATSNIDTRTEVLVQEAFSSLMKNRTSFIVAHRLSTIKNASIILVMNDGKIIEKGNHEELLNKKGFYYNLYNSQFVQA